MISEILWRCFSRFMVANKRANERANERANVKSRRHIMPD